MRVPSPARATLDNVKSIVVVSGPRDSGPGERGLMLERAQAVFEQLAVDDVTRVDVPGKGSGEEPTDSCLLYTSDAADEYQRV